MSTWRAESENEVFARQFKQLGMRIVETRPDGDCLFAAVADQVNRLEGGDAYLTAIAPLRVPRCMYIPAVRSGVYPNQYLTHQ